MWLSMLAALLTLTVVGGVTDRCVAPLVDNCLCQRSDAELDLSCPRNSTGRLQVRLVSKELKFQCTESTFWTDYDMLSGLSVGPVPSVTFILCPLPNSPLQTMFQSLGISEVKLLKFLNANLTNTLERSHLEGLTNLTQLFLPRSGITDLPEDLFLGVTSLTLLNLRENSLQNIRPHLFDHLVHLEILELGGNHMTHLEAGIFRNLTHLRLLNLWGNRLQNLTRDVFVGLSNLTSLDLTKNDIVSLGGDIFSELPQIKLLNLYGNKFSSLPAGLFSSSHNLETLKLYDNRQHLQQIPQGLLSNLTNLKYVYLNKCNLSALPSDTFWGSQKIVNISLQGNSFTTLPLELFRDTIQLENLDLSYNQLQTLSDGVFSSLKKLKVLKMGFNQLSTISKNLLQNLENLMHLDMEHNLLQHIDAQALVHVPKLLYLQLSHNMLSLQPLFDYSFDYSPLRHCMNLEELYLTNNSITTIYEDWILTMGHLSKLNLSHNLISEVETRSLMFLSNDIYVDLTYNNISKVDLQYVEKLALAQNASTSTRHILLEGNPLVCDCNVYNLLRYFEYRLEPKARALFELIPGNLTCVNPPTLQGILITDLPSRQMKCILSLKDCPHPCTCAMRPEDSALIIDCSRSQMTEIPAALPDPLTSGFKLNHTELWLEGNSIVTLPKNSSPGYKRITHLYLSQNNITSLTPDNLPPRIHVLELDNNNLTHLDAPVLQLLANESTQLTRLTLHANPWQCDCSARSLLGFLQEHFTQVPHLSSIICGDQSGRSLSNLTISDLCPASNTAAIAVGTIVAALGIIVGVMAALYYSYQREVKVWLYAHSLCLWFVTEQELDKDKLYDAFISYSHRDEEFVVNKLVPELESGATPYKLCLHYRDWIAGEWIPNQIARSVDESRRTLVVLSPSFLESVWGRMEFRTAHSQALSEGRARVIVLLYGDVGPLEQLDPELRAYLSMNTYVKWGDPWFWDKLRYALPHPQKRQSMEMKTHRKSVDDKLELITTPPANTTPPIETIVNPLEIATNGHATLLTETNGHVNSCFVKSM